MLSFANDYCFGAHPAVMAALTETNDEAAPGYCADRFCLSAAAMIRSAAQAPDAAVYFFAGGTQTNMAALAALLQQGEGVFAAGSGHIASHEAGAIESLGHKVLVLPQESGKVRAQTLAQALSAFYGDENHAHMVYPGALYLSHPTEFGTLYQKSELLALRRICDEYGLRLYLDGARLAYALGSEENDLTLSDLALLCDAFCIGGTKCGALCGEALVFPRGATFARMGNLQKRLGALPAKGRLFGVQFSALFSNGLYETIGKNAVGFAKRVGSALEEAGVALLCPVQTNQIFPVFEDGFLALLGQEVSYSFWEKTDETHTAVRLAAHWATTERDVEALIALIRRG